MAAKLSSGADQTGMMSLQHWIDQGQIQDLHPVFRITKLPHVQRLADLRTSRFEDLKVQNIIPLRYAKCLKTLELNYF